MNIQITDETSLLSVQNSFPEAFPFLQIRFYRNPSRSSNQLPENERIAETTIIREIKHIHASGVVEVYPFSKVASIEKEFLERFGLAVRILKKDKDGWQYITASDEHTLKELNEMGNNF